MFEDLLLPMFDDEYYPDILVAELKQLIEQFAKKVQKPAFADQRKQEDSGFATSVL